MQVRVGCSGWFYSHWRGLFYPRQEPTTKNWFGYYANVFDTVELNAPFYRWPKPATVRRWIRDAPPGFRYSVKVHQSITHERRLARTKSLVRDYYRLLAPLQEKLGCVLFQFPPGFHYSAPRLEGLTAQLDPAFRNVVEFRHRSWWRAKVFDALREHGITFAAVSAPRLPEEFPMDQKLFYLRLSGKTRWYHHDYSADELDGWKQRILTSGAEEAWIYFNNDAQAHAVKNALALRRRLRS